MLSEVMAYYGFTRDVRHVGYFETAQHQQIVAALKTAIKQGQLIALSGIVGCGKTTTLHRLQEVLGREPDIIVSKSLVVDKDRVHLGTLIMALFYDLTTEKDVTIPTQPEKRERQLLDLIHKRRKTVALFVDEAHDLHSRTLLGVKRVMELVRASGETLAVILAGVKGQQRAYLTWLLEQCTTTHDADAILTSPALTLLADRLTTPLQIEHYLTRALEEGYKIGQRPLTPELIESILARDLGDLEPHLTRHGSNAKALADLLNVRPTEIRAFLARRLPPGRSQELQQELLTAGLPL